MTYETAFRVGEKAASLFQLDTVLSAQHLDIDRRKPSSEPEKRLMFAVLEDAVACFQNARGKNLFRDAEKWILADNNDWLFSFENICEVLGFNLECIRQGLIRGNEQCIRQGLIRGKEQKPAERHKAPMCRLTPGLKRNKPGLLSHSDSRQRKDTMITHKRMLGSLLSAQEKRVLKLVVKGQANKEIAATLGISPSTVRCHIQNILRKLGLENRVQAAVFAVRAGDCPLEAGEK